MGLGCMGMSEFYGPTDEKQSIETLEHAVHLGINFFDTADMYGIGANEILLGKVLKPYRDKIYIATKFGFVRDPQNANTRAIDGRPEYVKKACDASLQRLGVNEIDLYYLHRVDTQVPIEDTFGAMSDLVNAGKVKFLGLSEVSAATIKRAAKIHPVTAIQSEYSLWSRTPEKEVLPLCEEMNIAFIPYSPLGRGFLTSHISSKEDLAKEDWRRTNPRLDDKNIAHNLKLVNELKNLATNKSCTPAQLALAWVLNKSKQIIPIPGTRRQRYLIENVNAIDLTLSPEEMTQLDQLFKPENIAGERYPEIGMKSVDL
jgi:aryl-alcohol dehydrogenase-like predicted oxidoreductase